jgi:hypothetical protein
MPIRFTAPILITLAVLLTDEELDSLEKRARDGEIAGGPFRISPERPPASWQSWGQRDHAGVDAGHQPVHFLPHVVPAEESAGAAGHVGDVGTPFIQDQPEAGP